MSGSKFQVAFLTGVIVAGGALVQNAVPRLADDLGMLYLRAEYKLATGDLGSAVRLMQQAANSHRKQQAPQDAQKPASVHQPPCPYSTGSPSLRAAASPAPPRMNPAVAGIWPPVRVNVIPTLQNLDQIRPDTWTRIQAGQWEGQRQYEQAMRILQASLKTIPPPPQAPVPLD